MIEIIKQMYQDMKYNRGGDASSNSILRKLAFPFLLLMVFAMFSSCVDDEARTEIPDGLIQRDTLVKLLIDIHLADAYLSQNRLPKTLGGRDVFYAGITKKYGYDRAIFDTTVHYLATQPKLYEDIYEEVLNELSLLQGQVEKEKAFLEENTSEGETFSYEKSINNEDPKMDGSLVQDSSTVKRLREAQERFERIRKKRKPADGKVKE